MPLAFLVAAGGLAVLRFLPEAPPPAPPVPDRVTIPVPAVPAKMVAVIIDDLGHNYPAARPFIEMDLPVALSILPGRPFSTELAEMALGRGKTVMLHLPMEPVGYPSTDPGPGAVLLSGTDDEIVETVIRDMASVPGLRGINNHMGSRATADARVMEAVIRTVRDRHLFFVDSRTTAGTVALATARRMGVPSVERDVFLDNETEPGAIDRRIDELLDLAEKNGLAVGIGHAHPETARALSRMAGKASGRGISWVPIERLVAYADAGN